MGYVHPISTAKDEKLPELDDAQNENDKPDVVDTDDVSTDTDDGADDKLIPQKELDRILQKRLKRQEEQFAKKYADYDKLKADADAYSKIQNEKSTDSERWERERNAFVASLQEKEEKLNKLERAALVTDLATEKGLPKSFWKRVSGDTAEEIEEDIADIIKDLGVNPEEGKKTTATPKKKTVYGGGGEGADLEPDTDQIVSKIPRGPQFRIDKPRSYR